MERLLICWLSINIKLPPSLAIPVLLALVLGVMLLWERRKIRRVIEQFVSLASHACIPTYRSVMTELSNELARTRRSQRAMSVMVLIMDTEIDFSSVKPMPGKKAQVIEGQLRVEQIPTMALVFPQIGYILRNTVRKSDIVACGPGPNEFVVALAETTKTQATPFVKRFQSLIASSGLAPLRSGIAEFPKDGLTIEDLVSKARASSTYGPPPQTDDELLPEMVSDHGLVARREAV